MPKTAKEPRERGRPYALEPPSRSAARRPATGESGVKGSAKKLAENLGRESDAHRLTQRQKQIDFGKNTIGYDRYVAEVPRDKRGPEHPRTPDKTQHMSKRQWDGRIRVWRRALHKWDDPGAAPPPDEEEEAAAGGGGGDSSAAATAPQAAGAGATGEERREGAVPSHLALHDEDDDVTFAASAFAEMAEDDLL